MLHEFIGVFNNKVDIKNKQKAFISFMGIKEGHQQSIKEKEEQ